MKREAQDGAGARPLWSRRSLPVLLLVTALVGVVAVVRLSGSGGAPVPVPPQTASPSPSAIAAEERPVVLFIGDSYAAGVGAGSGSARWTSLVADAEGWLELNLGRAGSGYTSSPPPIVCGYSRCPDYLAMAARAVEEQPDIVVVAGGQNDTVLAANHFEAERAAIEATFRTLRAGLPDARIVAVGLKPIWGVTAPLQRIEDSVRAAVESIGGLFIGLTTSSVIQPSYLLEDGIHVGDEGHAAIAAHVLAALDCWEGASASACSGESEDPPLQAD
jgi:lysophospholipase L1-like esterase